MIEEFEVGTESLLREACLINRNNIEDTGSGRVRIMIVVLVDR